MLWALQDIGGEGTTGEIQEHTPFPNRQSVHHQMNARLTPAGLVELTGTRENPGAAFDANVWRLTDDGWAFLRENRERLATNRNLELLTERFDRLAKSVRSVFGRVHDVEQRQPALEEQHAEHTRRTDKQYRHLHGTKLDVDDDGYRALLATVRHLTERVETLEAELGRVDGEIENVKLGERRLPGGPREVRRVEYAGTAFELDGSRDGGSGAFDVLGFDRLFDGCIAQEFSRVGHYWCGR